MEEGYEMITEIYVEEVSPDKYIMTADGIPAKEAVEERALPAQLTVMCSYCTFNFASLLVHGR